MFHFRLKYELKHNCPFPSYLITGQATTAVTVIITGLGVELMALHMLRHILYPHPRPSRLRRQGLSYCKCPKGKPDRRSFPLFKLVQTNTSPWEESYQMVDAENCTCSKFRAAAPGKTHLKADLQVRIISLDPKPASFKGGQS